MDFTKKQWNEAIAIIIADCQIELVTSLNPAYEYILSALLRIQNDVNIALDYASISNPEDSKQKTVEHLIMQLEHDLKEAKKMLNPKT